MHDQEPVTGKIAYNSMLKKLDDTLIGTGIYTRKLGGGIEISAMRRSSVVARILAVFLYCEHIHSTSPMINQILDNFRVDLHHSADVKSSVHVESTM